MQPGEERLLAGRASAGQEPRALEPADARLAETEFRVSPLIEILPDLPPEDLPKPPAPKLAPPRAPVPDVRIAKPVEKKQRRPGAFPNRLMRRSAIAPWPPASGSRPG